MGVLTSHVASEFFLPAKHKDAALTSLKNFVRKSSSPDEYVFDPDGVLNAATIVDALAAADLRATEGEDGDVVGLVWIGDKLPFDTYNMACLLDSIARFVRAGSFLELEEEFSPCKMTFRNGHASHDYTRYEAYDGSIARARRAADAEQYERAIRDLEYAIEIEPDFCMARVELASVYARAKRWDDAAAACEKAAAAPKKIYKGPSYTLDYSESAYAAYLHNADYAVGSLAVYYGEYAVAAPLLRRAARALPDTATVSWELAKALLGVRDYAGCLDAARNVLRVEPEHTYGDYYSAVALYHLARPKEALPHFARVSKKSPGWTSMVREYAEAARDAGEAKRAKQLGERALKQMLKRRAQAAGTANAWYDAGTAHALCMLERWEEARREAETALAKSEHDYFRHLLGVALMMRGEVEAAIPHLETSVRLDPVWEIPKYDLAQCYAKTGRHDEAERLFEIACSISPRLALRPVRA